MRTAAPASLAFALLASACSTQGSAAEAGSPGGDVDAGVGAVSFGGAQDLGDFTEILDNGGIPGPDTLDANGFFDEHYVPPPATGCTSTLCLTPGLSVGRDWLLGAPQATLQIAVDTNVDPTQYTRRALDVAVVVDRSGSMASDGRIDKVQLGLGQLIDGLQDGDRMALVTFSDTVTPIAGLGSGSGSASLDRAALHADVAAIVPGGGTDIYDGLAAGFNLLPTPTPDREQRVILLSDGEATSGDTSQDDIFAMSDSYISSGIGLTTIGVGSDFDLDLMRGLAEHGAGNFYFLEDDTAVTDVFTQELAYFMSPLALDLSIHATAGTGYQFGTITGSTLWTSAPTSGSMTIPAVFVAGRTSQSDPTGNNNRRGGGSMLYIALTSVGTPDAAGTVGRIDLTYKLPGGGDPQTQSVTLAYPDDPASTPPQDAPYLSAPEIAKRYAMYNIYLGLAAATQTTDVNCASVDLYSTEAAATAWNVPHEDTDIVADIALIDTYLANLRTVGATATAATTAATCANPNGDPGGDDEGPYGDDYAAEPVGCMSAGSGAGMLVGVCLAGLVMTGRRRRG